MKDFKKYLAEFIGTMVLVVFGCGSAISGNTRLSTAFAFGLVIVAMAYSIGNISGCHINPAVSTAMLILKKMSFKDFICYVVAQFLGGIAGAGILAFIFGIFDSFGTNSCGDLTYLQAFIVEIILTFVFVIAVIGVTSKKEYSNIAGIVIGLALTLVHILGIRLTGTSVNPARSFGPALLLGGEALSQIWIFILAPLVGAALAALVYMFLSGECVCCTAKKAEVDYSDDDSDDNDEDDSDDNDSDEDEATNDDENDK